MKKTLRGYLVYDPAVHMLWTRWTFLLDPTFSPGRGHEYHPLCRVPGKRKFKCSEKFEDITCRACLKRMALKFHGEELWRNQIIRCGKRMEARAERDRKGIDAKADLEIKRLSAINDCGRGDHSFYHGQCLDCGLTVRPI